MRHIVDEFNLPCARCLAAGMRPELVDSASKRKERERMMQESAKVGKDEARESAKYNVKSSNIDNMGQKSLDKVMMVLKENEILIHENIAE